MMRVYQAHDAKSTFFKTEHWMSTAQSNFLILTIIWVRVMFISIFGVQYVGHSKAQRHAHRIFPQLSTFGISEVRCVSTSTTTEKHSWVDRCSPWGMGQNSTTCHQASDWLHASTLCRMLRYFRRPHPLLIVTYVRSYYTILETSLAFFVRISHCFTLAYILHPENRNKHDTYSNNRQNEQITLSSAHSLSKSDSDTNCCVK